MEPLCELCGVVRAVVYCRSDVAKLCLHCDNCVHSANSLSCRHDRSLICDKCNSQPATVRCLEDKISLCQGCNWNDNGCSGPGHHRQKLSFYSGCPPLSEFSRIWSSVLDIPIPSAFDNNNNNNNNNSFNTLLTINENATMTATSSKRNECNNELSVMGGGGSGVGGLVANRLNELASCVKYEPWITNPPVIPVIPPNPNYNIMATNKDQSLLLTEELSGLPKLHGTLTAMDLEIHDEGDDDGLCEGVDLDDVALMLENTGYEMLGNSEVNSRYCKEDPLMEKNLSVTESNTSHIDNNALEASSCGQQDCLGFQSTRICSPVDLMQNLSATSNSLLMDPACTRNVGLGFLPPPPPPPPPPGQVHSSMSLSLSNITGESTAADYQDCGLSPMFLSAESPWESNLEPSGPHSRDKAKMRYHEKKKTRMFGKQIRYASRKARADTRRRVKGRFVKAGEAYDYDPLGN